LQQSVNAITAEFPHRKFKLFC